MIGVNDKFLVVIAGPTASGKTALAIILAKHFETEILSADSRQMYTEMNIGTAKPSPAQLSMVKHHFINCLSIHDMYDAGKYEADSLLIINKIFEKKNIAIMAGGSGLFINAACYGLDEMPSIDKHIRHSLNDEFSKHGLEPLQNKLKNIDPDYYQIVDLHNHVRIIRALEVYYSTNIPYSKFRKHNNKPRSFHVIKIALDVPRATLYNNIENRVEQMILSGLENEAFSLYPYKNLPALLSVGYKEFFEYFNGQIDKKTCVSNIIKNTKYYAKKQLTWFRKDPSYHWFSPHEVESIINHVETAVKNTL